MRLLILETNLLWSARLANAARSMGHEAVVSKDPREGDFDVVIVNLGTPQSDWPGLVKSLKARGMRIVAHAGHKEKELHDLGRLAGCDVLATNSEIANRLDRVLEQATKKTIKVAITGGIAEGKSTVLGYLADAGHRVASADAIAREVMKSAPVQEWLASELGQPAGREQIRERLSQDPAFRRALNQQTHPRILEAIHNDPAQFFEVPLLIESCSHADFDHVWVVTCGEDVQLARLLARLNSASKAKELLATQLSTRAKIPFADRVVRTNQAEETVRRIVIEAVSRFSA